MTEYLTTRDLIAIADAATAGQALLRDAGLIDSAAHRPMATVFGQDAYPDLFTKAAAILHSILRNHALVDGNKRLAWTACLVFLAINGVDADPDVDDAFEFVMKVAASDLDDLSDIASVLRGWAS
ncbi:MAG: type II toxin-antitoxin system death-on-curing family toxin [Catenulispora sp.]|nr:type II toxin-antitoxin system death-on-curing family toxin [Catenulispora sp.]